MFGIGGGELIFIVFIALMLFGSDKIPDIAKGMAKGMAQLKDATNEIKSEIQKGVEDNGLDSSLKELTSTFNKEVEKLKSNIDSPVLPEVTKSTENREDETGPIKRES